MRFFVRDCDLVPPIEIISVVFKIFLGRVGVENISVGLRFFR